MRDKADKRLWTLSIVGCVIVVLTVLFVSVKIETNNTKKDSFDDGIHQGSIFHV